MAPFKTDSKVEVEELGEKATSTQADENVTEHVSFVQNIPISKHPVFVARCAEIRTQTTAERRRLAFYYNIYMEHIKHIFHY